jgi:deoxyribodipyrimidine photo-lyase
MDALERILSDERVTDRAARSHEPGGRCVIYRMRRAQRAHDNPALETAIAVANLLRLPVVVFFGLLRRGRAANLRHYAFMLEGITDTAARLERRGVGFVLRTCEGGYSGPEFAAFTREVRPAVVIADENALRGDRRWNREARECAPAALWSVDADVIVPGHLLGKEHFAARTIRPKIHDRIDEFLHPIGNRVVGVKWNPRRPPASLDPLENLLATLRIDRSVAAAPAFRGGTAAALAALKRFIGGGLHGYAERRNHPELDATSRLSPYLHFGHIGPHTIALAARDASVPARDRDAFLEQLIVRRELAANFTRFNPRYKSLASAEPWALRSLASHRADPRAYYYTVRELENAATHDHLWNAAQCQMVSSGWMHGYMRMYWAKKILEWSESPEAAYEIAVALNDRYELDGRDPNGYAGIAWAIAGKHDRAWGPERPIYGLVRYMSNASTSRKFRSREYIEQWEK